MIIFVYSCVNFEEYDGIYTQVIFAFLSLAIAIALGYFFSKLKSFIDKDEMFRGMACDEKLMRDHNITFFTAAVINLAGAAF